AVHRIKTQRIMSAQAGDRSNQHGHAAGSLTNLPRHRLCEPFSGGPAHVSQLLAYSVIGKNAEEWGLIQTGQQSLPERVLKHWVTRVIDEIGENDGVFPGEFFPRPR